MAGCRAERNLPAAAQQRADCSRDGSLHLHNLLDTPGQASQSISNSVIPVAVNYPAPELSLQNVDGKSEALIDYRDQVVLVNNWAT